MSAIRQARLAQDHQRVQELFTELAQFIHDSILGRFGVGFDVNAKVAEWMAQPHEFLPPSGYLALASVESGIAGVGALRTIGERLGEIKHFYVRPQFRRQGLGRELLGNLVEQSVSMGHTALRLDTGWFMEAAQGLYHSFGFRDTDPYPESEVPKELHPFWLFMEKDLAASS